LRPVSLPTRCVASTRGWPCGGFPDHADVADCDPVRQDYPVIAGQNANDLPRQVGAIRDCRRNNGLTPMKREAVAQVTDEELAIITAWLALQ
jgi:cytochrome c553